MTEKSPGSRFRLIGGDCLTELKRLPENSVDSVVTDPPYGIDYQSAWRTDKAQWKPKIANDKTPFIWWLYDAFRVTRPGGAVVCFCRWDTQEVFRVAIEAAGFEIKSQVIWDRDDHGMGDLSAAFAPQHDVIWFAVKGKFTFPGLRPRSVIRSKRISAEKLIHPNEKPVELMAHLIRSVTPAGGIVLDPFAGSGATGVAALQSGYEFIGIECEPEYIASAEGRLEAALQQGGLFDSTHAETALKKHEPGGAS